MMGWLAELEAMDLSRTAMIGCEESGTVRRAFAALGIDVFSCDLLPAADRSNRHIVGDLRDYLHLPFGLLVIMHPPCTILCNSGVRWLYKGGNSANGPDPERWAELEEAALFYRRCRGAKALRSAIENPVMHRHAISLTGRGFTQFVQPWWFGAPAFKATGFELSNLPPLVKQNALTPPRAGTDEHKAWSKVHRMPPGPHRARDRSRTEPHLANALAWQWGRLLLDQPPATPPRQ